MFEIRSTYFRKRSRYHLESGDASSLNTVAIFDNLADAALALRYLNGGNLTDADLIRARDVFKAQDDKEAGQ